VFGVVELERTTDSFENRFGHAGGIAAFEAYVVLDTHPCQQCDFLTTQPRNPAATAEIRQPGLLRREPRPPGGQEFADVTSTVHAFEATT
jgi:hypothetical protein